VYVGHVPFSCGDWQAHDCDRMSKLHGDGESLLVDVRQLHSQRNHGPNPVLTAAVPVRMASFPLHEA